jgi:hypothetical protein
MEIRYDGMVLPTSDQGAPPTDTSLFQVIRPPLASPRLRPLHPSRLLLSITVGRPGNAGSGPLLAALLMTGGGEPVDSQPGSSQGSRGSVEADPGLVGEDGDPLGPQHRWELAQHAWQAPGRHHRHPVDDPAPGDLSAVDGHDRHHGHPRVGQGLTALAGNETPRRCRSP